MEITDYENLRDEILIVFKKRNTGFLTTETILKEVRFQKAILPKEDRERLDSILGIMRDHDLVLTNQPKFVALTPAGQQEVSNLSKERLAEIEKDAQARLA